MKHLYLLIGLSSLCKYSETHKYINIWDDNMDKNNGWTGHNTFNFACTSDQCITSPCTHVTANTNGPSYIQKITNITLYSSIQLQIDINAHNIQQMDSCQIWYNFDNSVYTKHTDWIQGIYKNVTIIFPQSIANKIYIKLQMMGNHGACYWDNAILKGIPIDHPKHTASPIDHPKHTLSPIDIHIYNASTYFTSLEPTDVQLSNSTTIIHQDINAIYANKNKPVIFDDFRFPLSIAAFSGLFCLCSIMFVIYRLMNKKKMHFKKKSNKKNRTKNTLSSKDEANISGQNIQKTAISHTIIGMSPLQLAEYKQFTYAKINNYNVQLPIEQVDNPPKHKQWIVPLKKGNFLQTNESVCNNENICVLNIANKCNSDSELEEMPSNRPHIVNNGTTTMTSTTLNLASVNSYDNEHMDQLTQVNLLKDAVNDATTSAQFSKLERILDKLEREAVQMIMDDNKYECSTDTSIYSITETDVEETVTETNLETASVTKFTPVQLNILRSKYMETFV